MRQLTFPAMERNSLAGLYEQRSKLKSGLLAYNTQKSYAHDWKMFRAWCEQADRTSLPATAETVSLYLTWLLGEGRKVSTAVRRTSGIAWAHRSEGCVSPITADVWDLLRGAQRIRRDRPRQMHPFTVSEIREISKQLAEQATPEAFRNRAILVVGFASALRRANLAALQLADIGYTPHGLVIRIEREKTDQEGRGRLIGLPHGRNPDTCPVECLNAWLACRGTAPGHLFTRTRERGLRPISPATVGRVVKRAAALIGLCPQFYAGHSLRSGLITEAGEAGVGELLLSAHTGHRDLNTLRRYFRPSDIWKANAAGMIGL